MLRNPDSISNTPHVCIQEDLCIMYEELKQAIVAACRIISQKNLARLSWCSVSAVDRDHSVMAISPEGMDPDTLTADKIAVIGLDNQKQSEGESAPAKDLQVHLQLYKKFPQIQSIAKVQSKWLTATAQAGNRIPPLGVLQADLLSGEVFCTRELSVKEIEKHYKKNLALTAVEALSQQRVYEDGAVLVRSHGPYVWAPTPADAVELSEKLEDICELNAMTKIVSDSEICYIPFALSRKRFSGTHQVPQVDTAIVAMFNDRENNK